MMALPLLDSADRGSCTKYDFIRTKRIFEAAVSTVKNMPQDGPFKPSYATMKTFYSLYKQATVGPCCVKKPSLFDPVGRAKWEAWSSLGDLSKEGAMVQYADEFVKALLANSQSSNIEQFSQSLHESPKTDASTQFISAIKPFLAAISTSIDGDNNIGDITGDGMGDNIGDSKSDDIGNSKRTDMVDDIGASKGDGRGDDIGDSKGDNGDAEPETVEIDDLSSCSENEDFCDTLDQVEISEDELNDISLTIKDPAIATYRPTQRVLQQEKVMSTEFSANTVVERQHESRRATTASSDQQLLLVLENIQRDMTEMISKINSLENLLKRNLAAKLDGRVSTSYIGHVTPKQMAVHAFFICVWPFVIRWFIKYIWCKKKD